MNSVLKSLFSQLTSPSWENGSAGTVLVCYVRVLKRDHPDINFASKCKVYYLNPVQKAGIVYSEMRAFLLDGHLSAAQFRAECGHNILAQHIALQYRLAAELDMQYVDANYVELDMTRDPGDRLAWYRTITSTTTNKG
jgi:hypothetical protein